MARRRSTEEAWVAVDLTRQELAETVQELANRVRTTTRQMRVDAMAAAGFGMFIAFIVRKLGHRR